MSEVLEKIWQHQQISRVELVEHTGLTSGTITNLTHELIELGVIREFEAVSGNVGRRRVMLGFDSRRYRIIGLDIGRATMEIVVVDLNGKIVRTIERDMSDRKGPDDYFEVIDPLLREVKRDIESEGYTILGLGVGVPGPMDYGAGTLLDPPNFPGWKNYPLRSVLEQKFGLTTLIEDDARTSAMAERWYGLGRTTQNLVFITMGIGIGGGVVTDGKIVRGTNGLCGQVGHMTIVINGKMCDCGNRGCWETVGSIPGILSRWSGGNSMEQLLAAVRAGEPEALKCMEDTLSYLETGLINVYNLYDPELVVLGGRLYPYLADYLLPVQNHLRSRLYAFAKDRLNIVPSTYGTSQSAVGAAALVFGFLLSEPVRLLALTEG
ncbi:ROK family transcriptional regulator [Paenibacillus ginsengarvi]|uniref:ROK family transcriptional regulator n=2 Tax=Paenibacillus ginsengarvi TaxID=400777 RepID=A0A3B0C1T3_9BACL|nr:ROK family transcriptional regulator [Paenibacillus ginsengarvi]